MEANISTYIQNQIRQAQQLESQIEQLASQRYQLDNRIKDIEKTLKELEGVAEGAAMYKNVGPVLYKIEDKKKLIDELSEQKELSEIRIKTIEKQLKALEQKYKELEDSIKKRYEEASKKGAQ